MWKWRCFVSAVALGLMASAEAQVSSPAQQAYDEVSPLRDRHASVIWGSKKASEPEMRAILADLDQGLAQLATPLNRDLAQGNIYLRFRRYNFLIDKAKLLARMGDSEGAIRALDDMSRMAWINPLEGGPYPDGDPDLKPVLTDPRVAYLRNRYAVGPRFSSASALKTPYRAQLSEAERLAGLSQVWSTARQGFVWFDHVPELDWDKAYLEAIARVKATKDTAAYYRELMRFVSLLKDGHSNVYPPEQLAGSFYTRPGLKTARVEGQVLVMEVRDPALAQKGVRVGDLILSVDGRPVDDYVARYVAPSVGSSTPQDLEVRSYNYLLLAGDAKRPVRLAMQHADGSRYTVVAPRSGYTQTPGKAREAFELRADGVAVLRVGQLEDDAAAKLLDENIDAVLQAKALVIDLRGNGGGSTHFGWMLLTWLQKAALPQPVSLVRADGAYEQTRMGPTLAPQWKTLPQSAFELERPKHYQGPVALLIDAATFSAAEDTAAAFKLMKRGPIVGTPSGGSTGQPLQIALPGGGSARICVKRDFYPDGSDFVGVGVQPDVVVTATVASVRAGTDPVLQRAVETLLPPKQ